MRNLISKYVGCIWANISLDMMAPFTTVAVCGLPEKRANHAVVMARFARDCIHSMEVQLRALETELGPGKHAT